MNATSASASGASPTPAPFFRIALAGVLILAIVAALVAYELAAFGWHPAREEPAAFSAYHLGRTVLMMIGGFALAAAFTRSGGAAGPPVIGGGTRSLAAAAMLAALAAALILPLDPALFHALAREDFVLEWASALLLFAGSLLFASAAAAAARRRLAWSGAACAVLAILYFVMGMEEISWMQRLFGFSTPQPVAEVNWQSEFNFHNIHTDLFELVFYSATGLFLLVLPLLALALPLPPRLAWLNRFLPTPTVAAVSAPAATLTYGHWNLLPIQLIIFAAIGAMLVFAGRAASAGARGDARLFAGLAAGIVVGQALILSYGSLMLDLPDATEFKELFICLGLACYAWFAARGAD